jgi:hypothetical protein
VVYPLQNRPFHSFSDVTTTVLTLTMTGLAANSPLARGAGTRSGRKILSILAMLLGALIVTLMLKTFGFMLPLAFAAVLAGVVSVIVALSIRSSRAGFVASGERPASRTARFTHRPVTARFRTSMPETSLRLPLSRSLSLDITASSMW